MNSKPLSYDSLKSVLKHTDANLRFKIAAQCPSIRATEKIVPLHIDRLEFCNENIFFINTMQNVYRLGIIRKNRDGPTPSSIESENKIGGIQLDVDRFGFTRRSYGMVTTPGDVAIRQSDWSNMRSDEDHYGEDEDAKRRCENDYQNCLSKLDELKKSENPSPYSIEYQESKTEMKKFELLRYSCRENDTDLNYENIVQLSCNLEPIAKLQYTRKLHEYTKYLLTRFFGGRSEPIHVKFMLEPASPQAIRLPVGVKFAVDYLVEYAFSNWKVLDSIQPIIDENRLKHVEIHDKDSLSHPLVMAADEVTLFGTLLNLHVLLSLKSKKITLEEPSNQLTKEEQYAFIHDLVESGREVGSCIQIACKSERSITNVFDLLDQRMNDRISFDFDKHILILQMNYSAELHVSYSKTCRVHKYKRFKQTIWFLKMELVPENLKRDSRYLEDEGDVKRAKNEG